MEAFLQPEQLSSDDEWYCPKCKEFVQVRGTCEGDVGGWEGCQGKVLS